MIETYAFVAMFTVQILTMSVLHPAWLIRFWRSKVNEFPQDRFAQLYPGVDRRRATERFLLRYRAVNVVIALSGVLLLGWMLRDMKLLSWDDVTVFYFMLQVSPLLLLGVLGIRERKVLSTALLDSKRKAVLHRRGLFDFVSPFTVGLAVIGYVLFVAYVIYIARHPFPGFAGPLVNIGGITMVYAVQVIAVSLMLYGRKFNPFESHEARMSWTGPGIKACVYTCIVCVVFISINLTLAWLELRTWKPLSTSAFLVVTALLCSMGVLASSRRTDGDGPGSAGRLMPGASDLSA